MPCGCQNACGCIVLGDGVTTTAVTVGDTTTVSAVQTFLGVLDTPCVNMTLAAGIVSANLTLLSTNSITLACGASGLSATLRVDPASTAPVSITAAGLRVDCCTSAGSLDIADTATIDMDTGGGILKANVKPNTSAGLENQASGVSIKLQDDPVPHAAVCENRLRFITGTGDLALLPDGIQVVPVADGTQQNIPTAVLGVSVNSINSSFTNNRNCRVYAIFTSQISLQATPGAVAAPANGRIISHQLQVGSGGGTTGTVVSGVGAANFTEINDVLLAATTIETRFRFQLSTMWQLDPGEVANAICFAVGLEALAGYASTVGGGSFIQATSNHWTVFTERQT